MSRARLLMEWLLGTLILCALAFVLSMPQGGGQPAGHTRRLDTVLFDSLQRLAQIAPSSDLLIIEIDDASLEQIGRWPWPRAVHALLFDRLAQAGVRAIGCDIQWIEATADDHLLAASLQRVRAAGIPVVLPVTATRDADGQPSPQYPVPELGQTAGLGHVHFRLDGDGVVRGLFLHEAGFPAFSLLVGTVDPRVQATGVARDALAQSSTAQRDVTVATGIWQTGRYVLLPPLSRSIDRVSYSQVLRGEIDPRRMAGRIVLVGANASGLGDRYANAVAQPGALSAGVELHGAALSALLQHRLIGMVSADWQVAVPVLIVLALMAALFRLTPQRGLLLTLGTALLILLASLAALRAGYWWSPAGALTSVLLAYPLWSWRRLEVATRGLAAQARSLAAEPVLLPPSRVDIAPAEPVARSVYQLQAVAARSLTLRRFLQMTLQRLPHPAFVTRADGMLVFANDRVAQMFGAMPERGTALGTWLSDQAGVELRGWPADVSHAEQTDRAGRSWLIDSARFEDPDWTAAILWQLVDITPIRQAEREREQTLSFLSHDLRAPQASILAIVDQWQSPDATTDPPKWLADIRLHAQRSLELADSFVQLARAQAKPIERQPLDLTILAAEAIDTCWQQAHARSISLRMQGTSEGAVVCGDAQLLRRAITNLIDNAVKFSPHAAPVLVDIHRDGEARWVIDVIDQGIGLSDETMSRLFEPYFRADNVANQPGAGLGLSFVKLVAERHGGSVRAKRQFQRGASFELSLPRAPDEAGNVTE